MAYEKIPKDYNPGTIQKVVEGLKRSIGISSKKSAQDLFDTSKEIKDSITKLAKKVANLAGEGGEQGQGATYTPVPEDLTVYEFGTWGFATVNPFLRWKYRGKIVGYEFYGTMNVDANGDFEPHESDYVQKGTHYAYNGTLLGQGNGTTQPNLYLHTQGPTALDSHILDRRLVKALASKRPILENVDTGEWGYIGGFQAIPFLPILVNPTMYKIFASRPTDPDDLTSAPIPLTWTDGDTWRIKEYPNQSLFSIGALAIFYKRLGNIYVKARTIGKGHSYSNFTESTSSTGVSSTETVDAPVIVMPKHQCAPGLIRECTLVEANNFKPYCTGCGKIVPWIEIVSGTREIDHWALFGFEYSSVEFVFEELDAALGEFQYITKRSIAGPDGEFKDGEDVEGEVG
jgi:hypothetical protein